MHRRPSPRRNARPVRLGLYTRGLLDGHDHDCYHGRMVASVDWMIPAQRLEWDKMWKEMTELQKERQPIAKKLGQTAGAGPSKKEFQRLLELNRLIVDLEQKQRELLDQHPMKQVIRALT